MRVSLCFLVLICISIGSQINRYHVNFIMQYNTIGFATFYVYAGPDAPCYFPYSFQGFIYQDPYDIISYMEFIYNSDVAIYKYGKIDLTVVTSRVIYSGQEVGFSMTLNCSTIPPMSFLVGVDVYDQATSMSAFSTIVTAVNGGIITSALAILMAFALII